MIAVIGDSAQAPSIALHRAAGFKMVGAFEAVGYKFDRWLDTVLMQRPLGKGASRRRNSRCHSGPRRLEPRMTRDHVATSFSDLSTARSTPSSSWPRLTISPVAEITL